MDVCYENCSNTTEALLNANLSYIEKENQFDLYCRDSNKLVIKIDHEQRSKESSVYMLVVQESTGKIIDRMIYFVSIFFNFRGLVYYDIKKT